MATLTLYRAEVDEAELPPFCMRCGEPATLVKQKRFSWGPGWVMALLAAGTLCSGPLFLIVLILIPIFLRRMRVPVPLCDRHRNHWLPLQVVLYGGIGLLAMGSFTAIMFFGMAASPSDPRVSLAGWFCVGTVAFLLAMLFPAAILQMHVIQPSEITAQHITLTKVAREFVAKVEEHRRKPAQVRPAGGC